MADNKPMGINILCWIEIVVAARVLLFTAPVLINKSISSALAASNMSDWFVLLLTMAALVHFIAGISAVIGLKTWRLFHYVAVVLVFCLTGGLISMAGKLATTLTAAHFVPLLLSIMLAGAVGFTKAAIEPKTV